MNSVLTPPRNVLDPSGQPTGHVIIEALLEDPYTQQPRAIGRVRFRGGHDGDVEVVCLFVDGRYRRRGLGARLLDEAADCCTHFGFGRLWIEASAPGHAEADIVYFLKQNQFRFSGGQGSYPLLMVRELPPEERPALCLDGDQDAGVNASAH